MCAYAFAPTNGIYFDALTRLFTVQNDLTKILMSRHQATLARDADAQLSSDEDEDFLRGRRHIS